jgi:hypothetical protein
VEYRAPGAGAGPRLHELDPVALLRDAVGFLEQMTRIPPHVQRIGGFLPGLERAFRAREKRRRSEISKVEPISPELALIDPELARTHLAWLERAAEVSAALESVPDPPAAIEPQVETQVRASLWRKGAGVAVALSLGLNGFLAAVIVARDHPSPAAQPPAAAVGVLAPPPVPDVPAAPTAAARSGAAIEQRILSLLVSSPRTRLPAALIDSATGLPKNGLQAVCRDGPSDSELCLVRPAQHRPGEGIYVRYTPSPDGRGTFTWSPYRSG